MPAACRKQQIAVTHGKWLGSVLGLVRLSVNRLLGFIDGQVMCHSLMHLSWLTAWFLLHPRLGLMAVPTSAQCQEMLPRFTGQSAHMSHMT
jgi:hypothetical protein